MIKIIKFFFESLMEYQSQKHQLMLLIEQKKHELNLFYSERMKGSVSEMDITDLLADNEILELAKTIIYKAKKHKNIDCFFSIKITIGTQDDFIDYRISSINDTLCFFRYYLSHKPITYNIYPSGDDYYDKYIERTNKQNLKLIKEEWALVSAMEFSNQQITNKNNNDKN
jgi:hypothetical protein